MFAVAGAVIGGGIAAATGAGIVGGAMLGAGLGSTVGGFISGNHSTSAQMQGYYAQQQAAQQSADAQAAAIKAAAEEQARAAREAAQIQAEAQRYAADVAAQAARHAADLQQQQYQTTRQDLAPWREAGVTANNHLMQIIQAGPGEFEASPGYQFRLQEGQKAIERSAAARGMQLSGPTLRALEQFGQDYATNDYDNFLRRYYQSLEPWKWESATGLSAAGTTSQAGAEAARMAGNLLMQGANAQAAGITGSAGDLASGVMGSSNALANALIQSANVQGQGMVNAADAYNRAQQARASGYIQQQNTLSSGLNNIFEILGYTGIGGGNRTFIDPYAPGMQYRTLGT